MGIAEDMAFKQGNFLQIMYKNKYFEGTNLVNFSELSELAQTLSH